MPINFQFGQQRDEQFERKSEEGRRISQFSTAAASIPKEMQTLPNLAAIAGEFGVLDPLKAVADFIKLRDALAGVPDVQPGGTVPSTSILPAAQATGTTGLLPSVPAPPLGRTPTGVPVGAADILPFLPPGYATPGGATPNIGTPGQAFFGPESPTPMEPGGYIPTELASRISKLAVPLPESESPTALTGALGATAKKAGVPLDVSQWTKKDADKFFATKEDIEQLTGLDALSKMSIVAASAGIKIRDAVMRGTLTPDEAKKLQEEWKKSPFHSEDFLTALFESARGYRPPGLPPPGAVK